MAQQLYSNLVRSGRKQPHEPLTVCAFSFMKQKYMKAAYKEALKAYKEDEVPIGCVIVKDDKIISRAHNRKEKKQTSVAHAEIEAIQKACRKLNDWHLDGCELYVTLEPCMMCSGAIILSRIKKVHFACKDPKGGAMGSNLDIKQIPRLNHYPEYEGGEMEEECAKLLKDFFKEKRK